MKHLILLGIITLFLSVNIHARNNDGGITISAKGSIGLVSKNLVTVFQNGNKLTTTFNTDMHATVVVRKATSAYTRSVTSDIVSTQTVDAKEFDELTTVVEDYELGVKYIIEIITPEGTLEGEFEFSCD